MFIQIDDNTLINTALVAKIQRTTTGALLYVGGDPIHLSQDALAALLQGLAPPPSNQAPAPATFWTRFKSVLGA